MSFRFPQRRLRLGDPLLRRGPKPTPSHTSVSPHTRAIPVAQAEQMLGPVASISRCAAVPQDRNWMTPGDPVTVVILHTECTLGLGVTAVDGFA